MGARPDVPVIVVTALGSMEAAVEAMRAGAYDFLNKPVDANALGLALRRAVQHHRLQDEIRLLSVPNAVPSTEWIIGESEPIKRVKDIVARVGASEATALVQGETGTGKEIIARAVHRFSSRSAGPFVAINCAAMPATLLESELFGHARGAFTDAKSRATGCSCRRRRDAVPRRDWRDAARDAGQAAAGAAGAMVRPVGGERGDAVRRPHRRRDATATSRPRSTRSDSARTCSIASTSSTSTCRRCASAAATSCSSRSTFLETYRRAPDKPIIGYLAAGRALLMAYDWPGNVRELENCIERAVALARLSSVSAEDLPESDPDVQPQTVLDGNGRRPGDPFARRARKAVHHAGTEIVDGNRSRAATCWASTDEPSTESSIVILATERPIQSGTRGFSSNAEASTKHSWCAVTQDAPISDSEYVRTKFLGRIAHDLRGPAGVTLGALDEIERVLGPRADELRPLLQMANRGLRRILRSADRLDQTSSLEASHDWKTTRCDLNVTLQQVVHEIQLTEGRERVTVDHPSAGAPCIASVDVPWIRAALGEILSNAIRFARAHVVIDARETATEVRVVVSDDGPGFSGPVSPRFSRSTTRRGLGLSLPIVEDVIRGHGGQVRFRDRHEEDPSQTGTSVSVTLPRGAEARGCP